VSWLSLTRTRDVTSAHRHDMMFVGSPAAAGSRSVEPLAEEDF